MVEIPVINGWTILAHEQFIIQYKALINKVLKEQRKDPNYQTSDAFKLLTEITKDLKEDVPANPRNTNFTQGHTVDPNATGWFRTKPSQQYRLFFRYSSADKIIIFGWFNDETTLRAYGSPTDAYATFQKMLADGKPPNDWKSLRAEAEIATANFQLPMPPKTAAAAPEPVDEKPRKAKKAKGKKRDT